MLVKYGIEEFPTLLILEKTKKGYNELIYNGEKTFDKISDFHHFLNDSYTIFCLYGMILTQLNICLNSSFLAGMVANPRAY